MEDSQSNKEWYQEKEVEYVPLSPGVSMARKISGFFIILSLTTLVACFVIKLPETRTASFKLVANKEGDPIRALKSGTVEKLSVRVGDRVAEGQALFYIRSEDVSFRKSDFDTLKERGEAALEKKQRLAERKTQVEASYAAKLLAKDQEIAALREQVELQDNLKKLAKEVYERGEELYKSKVISWYQYSQLKIDYEKANAEHSAAKRSLESSQLEKQDIVATRDGLLVQFREEAAELNTSKREDEIKLAAFSSLGEASDKGYDLVVKSPYSGTVVKLNVKSEGAVVNSGELLAEIIPDSSDLYAKLMLAEKDMGMVLANKDKQDFSLSLLFDAYPYQRYGKAKAALDWISPSPELSDSGVYFLAHAKFNKSAVAASKIRPQYGLTGTARIILGRRSIMSFLFEPVRELGERL